MKTFGTVAGLANFCVFSAWWFYANIGRYKKAHGQVSALAVISIPKNYLTPCIMQLCRALVKAYAMNPLLHAPVLFFFVPLLMVFAIYKTRSI
jgi:hypothetical protein